MEPVPDPLEATGYGVETGSLLDAAEDAPPGAAVEVVARQLLQSVGATEVIFLISDLSGERLMPLTRISQTSPDSDSIAVEINNSHAGVALRKQLTQVVIGHDDTTLFSPVTSRGDAIGVLVITLVKAPSEAVIEQVEGAAHALAYIVIANRRHTDLFEWGQRGGAMTLAAEIQRRIIPGSFTCEAGWFTVAGWLEPSNDVAGDTFDYSFDEKRLSLSLTDAMGHSVDSALLATVALAAMRNSRRAGGNLLATAQSANDELARHASNDQFVSGLLVEIPLGRGPATVINAGHPVPFVLRRGEIVCPQLTADVPFGMFGDTRYTVQELDLELGDRLIMVTDGLLERNAANFDIREAIIGRADLHPREFVRELCADVTSAAGGVLADDATVLCFDWHDLPRMRRHSHAGSNDVGASA